MKRIIIFFMAFFCLASFLHAAAENEVLAYSFNDEQSYIDFQKNLSLLKDQEAIFSKLKTDIALQKDENIKNSLKMQAAKIEEVINNNNALMIKSYNFAIDRKYRFVFIDTDILLAAKADEKGAFDYMGKKVVKVKNLNTIKENEALYRALSSLQMQKMSLQKLNSLLTKDIKDEDKEKISSQITRTQNAINLINETLTKDFNFQKNKQHLIKVNKCDLYLILNKDEKQKVSK